MSDGPQLRTERLLLRRWLTKDLEPFAALNADPAVMEYFPSVLSELESDALAMRIESEFEREEFGLWAVEVIDTGEFIGYVGLSRPRFDAPFLPAVEIAWRLAASAWGNGYATEAGLEVMRYAFDELSLPEVVSFTVPHNARSRRLMERLGMEHDKAGDFDRSTVEDPRFRRHVLYRRSAQNP